MSLLQSSNGRFTYNICENTNTKSILIIIIKLSLLYGPLSCEWKRFYILPYTLQVGCSILPHTVESKDCCTTQNSMVSIWAWANTQTNPISSSLIKIIKISETWWGPLQLSIKKGEKKNNLGLANMSTMLPLLLLLIFFLLLLSYSSFTTSSSSFFLHPSSSVPLLPLPLLPLLHCQNTGTYRHTICWYTGTDWSDRLPKWVPYLKRQSLVESLLEDDNKFSLIHK